MYFDKEEVKRAAAGRWDQIFAALAPALKDAQAKPGQHVPCPVHGGEDGFRLFPHYAQSGQGICNSCGARTDGFAMLQWVNHWTFREAVESVAEYLLHDVHVSNPQPRKGQVFKGVLVSAGLKPWKDGKLTYQVELLRGNTSAFYTGAGLQMALQAASAARGDLVELNKVRTERRQSSRGEYLYNVWEVRVLARAEHSTKAPVAQAPAQVTNTAAKRHEAVERLWGSALPIRKDREAVKPALDYFAFRGVSDARWSDETLRYVPNALYKAPDGTISRHPALVAAVRTLNGDIVTLHRTYLSHEGRKADVKEPKKLMALGEGETMRGASIQLGKPLDILCVAEGIETALSVQLVTGLPCWSTISANGMRAVEIPERVRTVLIFADKDASGTGQVAAEALRRRLAEERRLAVVMEVPDAIPEGSKGLD